MIPRKTLYLLPHSSMHHMCWSNVSIQSTTQTDNMLLSSAHHVLCHVLLHLVPMNSTLVVCIKLMGCRKRQKELTWRSASAGHWGTSWARPPCSAAGWHSASPRRRACWAGPSPSGRLAPSEGWRGRESQTAQRHIISTPCFTVCLSHLCLPKKDNFSVSLLLILVNVIKS